MAKTLTAVVDTNNRNAVSASLALTAETLITIYSTALTGKTLGYRLLLQVSPDGGTTWAEDDDHILTGNGFFTLQVVATHVRVKVVGIAGAESTTTIRILAA